MKSIVQGVGRIWQSVNAGTRVHGLSDIIIDIDQTRAGDEPCCHHYTHYTFPYPHKTLCNYALFKLLVKLI